jgi:plastocyanin
MNLARLGLKSVATMSIALIFTITGRAADIAGKVGVQGIKSPKNIAVYVDAIPGKTFTPPAEHALVDQRGKSFVPHVTVVPLGTTVDFVNNDSVGHNAYWPSISGNKKMAHNLGTWPKGEKRSFQFTDPGIVPLLCIVHPEMSAYLVVSPTPYFAITGEDGSFEIKNVPPGTYTLKTWSEDGKGATQSVTVAGSKVNVELTVKK